MKTYCSALIKKKDMAPGMADDLLICIQTYSMLLRTMVRQLRSPIDKGEPSLHVQYTGYNISDYLTTSLERAAKGVRQSARECLALNIEAKESRVQQAYKKISTLERQIKNMQIVKASLIARTKARKKGEMPPEFKSYFGSGIKAIAGSDGSLCFEVSRSNKKDKRPPLRFANEYLFEVQYVNQFIRSRHRKIQQIKGRIYNLMTTLLRLKADLKTENYHICFGSKKMMRQRHTTKNVDDWRNAFNKRRLREMMLAGRHDASQGNFMVKYDVVSHTLTCSKMIGDLEIVIPGVVFPYGQENINMAVSASESVKLNKKLPAEKKIPCWEKGPVTWIIKDCGNAFQVKCVISVPENKNINTCYDNGCVSFDMNYDHLAVAELNAQGQLKKHFVASFKMDGRTSDQINNAISEALEKVFKLAVATKKPVAMENIKKLKKELMYGNSIRNRKISQFAYAKIEELAENKSQKYGVAIRRVNPAYTSQIGRLKYMKSLGLSIHESAAYMVGRRAMGSRDKVPKKMKHLLPKSCRGKHHWSQWSRISKTLKDIPTSKFYGDINYKGYKTLTKLKEALAA